MAEGDGPAHDSRSHTLLTRVHFHKTQVDTEQTPCLEDLSGECSRQGKKKTTKKQPKFKDPQAALIAGK